MPKRILIIFTIFCFLAQNTVAGLPIYLENVVSINKKIFIPESYGIVEKSSFDKYSSQKFVFLLKDAHCNYDAQHNIAKILEVLVRDYKIDMVAMEGAVELLDYNKFETLPNDTAREKTADTFVKRGILTGPEYLKISKDGKLAFNIYGIENEKLYMENFIMFRQTIEHLEETELFIGELNRIVKNLKEKIYTTELMEFDDKAASYYENAFALTDWIKELNVQAGRTGMELKGYPNFMLTLDSIILEEGIDFKKVEEERAVALNNLEKVLSQEGLKDMLEKSLQFRLGKIAAVDYYKYLGDVLAQNGVDAAGKFQNLMKYAQLVKFQSWINNNALFHEISKIEDNIKETMFKSDIQKQLNDLSKRARILKGLFKLTLTREDVSYYRDHKEEFMPKSLLSFIYLQASLNGVPVSMLLNNQEFIEKISVVISNGEKFYEIALERDMSLVENALRIMDEKQKPNAVMVIGGFHADGVLSLLEEKEVGYMVISPKIVKAEKDTIYLSLMTDARIKLPQEKSSLAFPKLLADGENVARLIVPMGAEGWRRGLIQLAMNLYQKSLGMKIEGEMAESPFFFSVNSDGTIKAERNPDYRDRDNPNMVLEWFRLGLQESINSITDTEERKRLEAFVLDSDNQEKYLGRPAVMEYRVKTSGTLDEGRLRQATLEFFKLYLELCKLYEEKGLIGIQEKLGGQAKEFLPESVKIQEGDGRKAAGIRDDLVNALKGKKKDIDPAVIEAAVNYLLTMPAYGVDQNGVFYQTLFFNSYIRLIKSVFEAEKDERLQQFFDRIQAYRFLQVYLAKLLNVENTEYLLESDNLIKILAAERLKPGEIIGKKTEKMAEILARYFSGDVFPEDINKSIIKLVNREGRLSEFKGVDWVRFAGGVVVANEKSVADPLKREVYVAKISKIGEEGDPLKAFDRYIEEKKKFDEGSKPYDETLADIKNRTFVHDISMLLGNVEQVGENTYRYSDFGSIDLNFVKAIQNSKYNNQIFLYTDQREMEAFKAYLARNDIFLDDRQFVHISEYGNEGKIPREGRVVVSMLSDSLGKQIAPLDKDRVLVGNSDGTDLMLMNRMALIIAGPEDIVEQTDRIKAEIRELLSKYCVVEGEDVVAKLIGEIEITKSGMLKITLPKMTPFVAEYYKTLKNTRETISIAA